MLRDPMITCVDDDEQTVFEYDVLYGPEVASEHVGWILIVEGPAPIEPQYVTPAEFVGDLHSMGIDDDGMHYMVRIGTEVMLKQLRSRPDASDASSAAARMIEQVRGELDRLPAVKVD